jgi:hypothetical protein
MKSGLFVLFTCLILCSFTNSMKMQNKLGSTQLKYESVINSYSTPMNLKGMEKPNDEIENKEFSGYTTVISNFVQKKEKIQNKHKSLENSNVNSKFEIPTVVHNLHNNALQHNNHNKDFGLKATKASMKNLSQSLQEDMVKSSQQTVSNKEAFNAMYPDPEVFEDEVTAVKIYDENLEETRKTMKDFYQKKLDDGIIPKINDVSQVDKRQLLPKIEMKSEDFPKNKPIDLEAKKDQLDITNSKIFNVKNQEFEEAS